MEAQVVFRSQAMLAEGPLWDADQQALWWVDIERGEVHRFDPATGQDRSQSLGYRVGTVAVRQHGGLLMASHQGIANLDFDSGAVERLFHPESDSPQNRFNDGKCDPTGRFWAGTMNLQPDKFSTGALYSLHPQEGLRKHFGGVGVSNGIAWSSDGRRMFFIDSMIHTVDCFDFDGVSGTLSNRRTIFEVPKELGVADGMCIDDEGKLWIAFWDGWSVGRIDPEYGAIIDQIELPVANVTSCAFGGPSLDQLFITTARHGLIPTELADQPHAGDLFVAKPGGRGAAPTIYPG
jgi:sugar lactone lactonase YvrE